MANDKKTVHLYLPLINKEDVKKSVEPADLKKSVRLYIEVK